MAESNGVYSYSCIYHDVHGIQYVKAYVERLIVTSTIEFLSLQRNTRKSAQLTKKIGLDPLEGYCSFASNKLMVKEKEHRTRKN